MTCHLCVLHYAKDETIPILLWPLAIDVFISEYALNAWSQAVIPRRDCLIGYVCRAAIIRRSDHPDSIYQGKGSVLKFSPEQTTRAVEELHQLSFRVLLVKNQHNDAMGQ